MKRINIIYIVALILGVVLYQQYAKIKSSAALFYGFAENKETEIRHDKNVMIDKIFVTTGQKVKKGDVLLVVRNTKLPTQIDELELKKKVVTFNSFQDVKQIKFKISDLRLLKANKINEINAKINELNKEIELNTSLFDGLKSIKKNKDSSPSPKLDQIKYFEDRMNEIANNYNQEIAFQEDILSRVEKPARMQKDILDSKLSHFKNEKDKLSMYAPSDGIIGNILCKEQENIASFTTLLNFYQSNPTLVKGYVHESLLLKVKVGNKLEIVSTMHINNKIVGEVIGLGSRIVEIPERLRKITEIKTYGREVLIKISPKNQFLQNEKVTLNTISKKGKSSFMSSLF